MKEKIERNKDLVRMHKEHPRLSYADLGCIFYISKQAVHVILKRYREKQQESPHSCSQILSPQIKSCQSPQVKNLGGLRRFMGKLLVILKWRSK